MGRNRRVALEHRSQGSTTDLSHGRLGRDAGGCFLPHLVDRTAEALAEASSEA